MSSPFPGMDPYLEGELWQEFRATLASELRNQLLPRLRPKCVALLEKRYVVDQPIFGIAQATRGPVIYPDVHVVRRPAAAGERPASGVAVMSPTVETPLDLQAAVDACFALVGYEDLLDYSAPLPRPHP